MTVTKRRGRLPVGIVGAGTVGTALAVGLQQAGYPVVAAGSRSFASAQRLAEQVPGCAAVPQLQQVVDRAELVFLTVPDDAIRDVADNLEWRTLQMAVHCSGAQPLTVLRGPRHLGAQVGALHPLQTFSSVRAALDNMPGSTFAVEADEPLLGILKGIVGDLGGRWVELRAEDRVLYHVSGVLASNYLVTLLALAADLWEEFGIERKEGLEALLPLVRGTLHNVEENGIPASLTGPIARGDVGTIEKHLRELAERRPDLVDFYRDLALRTVPIAEEKGRLSAEGADRLRDLLHKELVREGER